MSKYIKFIDVPLFPVFGLPWAAVIPYFRDLRPCLSQGPELCWHCISFRYHLGLLGYRSSQERYELSKTDADSYPPRNQRRGHRQQGQCSFLREVKHIPELFLIFVCSRIPKCVSTKNTRASWHHFPQVSVRSEPRHPFQAPETKPKPRAPESHEGQVCYPSRSNVNGRGVMPARQELVEA